MYSLNNVFLVQNSLFKYSRLAVLFVSSCALIIASFLFITSNESSAKSVYDDQPPLTNKELVSFIELLPHFRAWAIPNNIKAHPTVNKIGKADFIYSKEAAQWVTSKNWEPARFFSVMGRAAAALAVIEEGNDLLTRRPTDMPTVTDAELHLVRQHLGSLLKAGRAAPPIK